MAMNTAQVVSRHLMPSAEFGGLFAQKPERPDPTERKHKGDSASAEAWARTVAVVDDHHYTIMRLIQTRRQKERGLTAKAYARYVGWLRGERVDLNKVSARFSELKDARRIVKSGRRRNKCGVWVLAVETMP